MVAVSERKSQIKAVLFDFMGTCLDWHSSIASTLPEQLSESFRSRFALDWRQTYFNANSARLANGLAPEDIDITHRRTLDEMLERHPDVQHYFSEEKKAQLIDAWHNQKAWQDVAESIRRLKEDQGLEVFVHANGTARLQLDLVQFAGLKFDMLFSSEVLGVYKPAPENYERVLNLLKRKPEECVMVAAHAYDVRGAKAAGMKTIYIYRWTDDVEEDQEVIKKELDVYLNDMTGLAEAVSAL